MTDEARNALHAKGGSRQVKYRYDLIRKGIVIGALPVISASISNGLEQQIKRTARFEIAEDSRINWLTDRIRPVMLVRLADGTKTVKKTVSSWASLREFTWADLSGYTWDYLASGGKARRKEAAERWEEIPLGVFVPSTPTRSYDGASVTYSVEAYDLTVIIAEDCVTDHCFIAEGTNYIDAVEALLLSAGIDSVISTPSAEVLPTAREFEIGTSKLSIINTLLTEINYNTVTVNSDGVFLLTPYTEPTPDDISIRYSADEISVMGYPATTELDLYGVPNIFIAVCSNPELGTDLKSVYTNDNPASELSTIRRGRNIVSQIYKPDAITSQEELDKYIRRIAFEGSQIYQKISFETLVMPEHETGTVLEIHHPDFSGVFREYSWSMDLSTGGIMQHEVRRLMAI